MSEMIERVARSLCASGGGDPDASAGWLLQPDRKLWENHVADARAAIEAMRHYNFEMEQACMKAMKDGEPFELVWERAFNIALRP